MLPNTKELVFEINELEVSIRVLLTEIDELEDQLAEKRLSLSLLEESNRNEYVNLRDHYHQEVQLASLKLAQLRNKLEKYENNRAELNNKLHLAEQRSPAAQ